MSIENQDHPYYASESNYYSNDAFLEYDNVTEFLNEFEDADLDLNQVFRWDIYGKEDGREMNVQIIIIKQRKGVYMPCHIREYPTPEELTRLEKYLARHWENLNKIWAPFGHKGDNQ